jgi:hypothetical protein
MLSSQIRSMKSIVNTAIFRRMIFTSSTTRTSESRQRHVSLFSSQIRSMKAIVNAALFGYVVFTVHALINHGNVTVHFLDSSPKLPTSCQILQCCTSTDEANHQNYNLSCQSSLLLRRVIFSNTRLRRLLFFRRLSCLKRDGHVVAAASIASSYGFVYLRSVDSVRKA